MTRALLVLAIGLVVGFTGGVLWESSGDDRDLRRAWEVGNDLGYQGGVEDGIASVDCASPEGPTP